eukprot:43368_1
MQWIIVDSNTSGSGTALRLFGSSIVCNDTLCYMKSITFENIGSTGDNTMALQLFPANANSTSGPYAMYDVEFGETGSSCNCYQTRNEKVPDSSIITTENDILNTLTCQRHCYNHTKCKYFQYTPELNICSLLFNDTESGRISSTNTIIFGKFTCAPTGSPTNSPSVAPSMAPTAAPSASPTLNPTPQPTNHPTHHPSHRPTPKPTPRPTERPRSDDDPEPPEWPIEPAFGGVVAFFEGAGDVLAGTMIAAGTIFAVTTLPPINSYPTSRPTLRPSFSPIHGDQTRHPTHSPTKPPTVYHNDAIMCFENNTAYDELNGEYVYYTWDYNKNGPIYYNQNNDYYLFPYIYDIDNNTYGGFYIYNLSLCVIGYIYEGESFNPDQCNFWFNYVDNNYTLDTQFNGHYCTEQDSIPTANLCLKNNTIYDNINGGYEYIAWDYSSNGGIYYNNYNTYLNFSYIYLFPWTFNVETRGYWVGYSPQTSTTLCTINISIAQSYDYIVDISQCVWYNLIWDTQQWVWVEDLHMFSESKKSCKTTMEPTSVPTSEPTTDPTEEPTSEPTTDPTEEPTSEPTTDPTEEPTNEPTSEPTSAPTSGPTSEPTNEPTKEPTSTPTPEPTTEPTSEPTNEPTKEPTSTPTPEPTTEPTSEPTLEPTLHPLFTLISTTINTPIPVPSPSPSDKPSTDFTFIQENYLWIIIGGSALLCICLIVLVFIIRNHVTKKKLKSELQNTNQEITNEALKEEKKPMNVRTIERTSEDNNNNNNN